MSVDDDYMVAYKSLSGFEGNRCGTAFEVMQIIAQYQEQWNSFTVHRSKAQ